MSSTGTSFYVTGGTLRLDAPSYVERNADKDLLDGLIASEFCYVLSSRQMGKSSLMVRTASRLRERGVHVVVLDLSAVGQNVTRDQWYNGLLTSMGDQLGAEDELDEFWKAHQELSPVQRWFYALTKVVLGRRSGPVVVFIDEIDVVRSLPFSTDEFFAAIRECYNRRAGDAKFCRLTFCLLGVATPSDLVRNANITPFNIGRRIELDDFTSEDAKPLARGLHTEGPRAAQLLGRVLYWTSGHPYLTQRICLALARDLQANRPGDVDRRCDELFLNTRARDRDDNLVFVRDRILRSDVDLTDLLELYLKSWKGEDVNVDEASPIVSVLRLSGIVRAEGGRLSERNRIYHQVFDKAWVKANLPDAELRRQRVAFRRGVIRTTAVSAVVILVMTAMILFMADKANKARRALAEASFSRALEKRASGFAGQRYGSVSALEEASRYYTNRAALRDELIASLALQDLKEKAWNYPIPEESGHYELNPGEGVCASAGTNGTIVVRSLQDGRVVNSLALHGSVVKRIRFGPDSALVAEYSGGSSGLTAVWDWVKGERLFTIPHGVHSEALDFSKDGKKLAVGQVTGRLTVYTLPNGEIVYERKLKWEGGLPRVPQVVRFDPTGERLAESCLEDLNVQVWNLNPGKRSRPLALFHPAPVYDLSWHPGGEFLATGCADSKIYLWNPARADRPVKRLIGHESEVLAVSFNHHGTLLASAGADETVRLWMPATERNVVFNLEGEDVNRLQFGPTGSELIAVNGALNKQRRWEISGEEYGVLPLWTGSHELRGLDFSPDGRWLAAASRERATIWDARTGAEYAFLTMTNARAVGFSSDSRNLFASTEESLIQHSLSASTVPNRAIRHQAEPRIIPLKDNQLGTMTLTFDRTTAAVVNVHNVLIVPMGTSRSEPRILATTNHYDRLALHPGGKWLAASTLERASIDIWDLTKENPCVASTLPASEYFVFSSDGKWLVTCWKGEFNFYRTGKWSECFPIAREQASNQHAPAAFSHDGKMVALAVNRYDIQIFLLPNDGAFRLNLIATLRAPDRQPLEMLAFSPDGRRLAAGTANLMIQVWKLDLLRDRLARLNLENGWPGYDKPLESAKKLSAQ